jgi:hypothetical protein
MCGCGRRRRARPPHATPPSNGPGPTAYTRPGPHPSHPPSATTTPAAARRTRGPHVHATAPAGQAVGRGGGVDRRSGCKMPPLRGRAAPGDCWPVACCPALLQGRSSTPPRPTHGTLLHGLLLVHLAMLRTRRRGVARLFKCLSPLASPVPLASSILFLLLFQCPSAPGRIPSRPTRAPPGPAYLSGPLEPSRAQRMGRDGGEARVRCEPTIAFDSLRVRREWQLRAPTAARPRRCAPPRLPPRAAHPAAASKDTSLLCLDSMAAKGTRVRGNVCACVRVRVRACLRVCARACGWVRERVSVRVRADMCVPHNRKVGGRPGHPAA